jgi:hypothetical protein
MFLVFFSHVKNKSTKEHHMLVIVSYSPTFGVHPMWAYAKITHRFINMLISVGFDSWRICASWMRTHKSLWIPLKIPTGKCMETTPVWCGGGGKTAEKSEPKTWAQESARSLWHCLDRLVGRQRSPYRDCWHMPFETENGQMSDAMLSMWNVLITTHFGF